VENGEQSGPDGLWSPRQIKRVGREKVQFAEKETRVTILDISIRSNDLIPLRIQQNREAPIPNSPAHRTPDKSTPAMNRRVLREIVIALAIFAAIVLAFVAIAQFG